MHQDILRFDIAVNNVVGMRVTKARQDLAKNRNRFGNRQPLRRDQRPQTCAGNVFHRQVWRAGIRIEPDGPHDVRVYQPMDRAPFALKVAKVHRIGWDFDGHQLIGPNMVMRAPDFAKGSPADLLVQDVFADALIGSRHNFAPL